MKKTRFTCQDVAELYGVHIQTVWNWIKKGHLNAVRISNVYYIRQKDLDEMEERLAVRTGATV